MSTLTEKPRVVLGLMTFGPPETAKLGSRITDVKEFRRTLQAFKDRGYIEIDTARTYAGAKQESFTRDAGWQEYGFSMSTKIRYPRDDGANNAEGVEHSVAQSLAELGTDKVDILYLHTADRATPFSETLQAVDKLYKAGKFGRLGLSNFSAAEVAEIVLTAKYNGWVRPTIYQAMYNSITRHAEPELFVALRRFGIDILAYNPLAGGLFSGKIKSAETPAQQGRFDTSTFIGNNYRGRYFKAAIFEALRIIEAAVDGHPDLSLVETALRWMVHHSQLNVFPHKGGKDGILIGVSSLEQLHQNLDALEKGPLPNDVVEAIDEAWHVSKVDAPPYWQKELVYKYDTLASLFGPGAL